MRAIVMLLALVASAPAWGQDEAAAPAEEGVGPAAPEQEAVDVAGAALAAAQVHEAQCADTRGNDVSVFGAAMGRVSDALVQVSGAYDRSRDPSLLFWRGLLALCVGRDDVGAADLSAFLDAVGSQSAYADQSRDAQRRLRRVQVAADRGASSGPDPGGIVAGAGMAAGAGAFAGLSSWQALELRTTTQNLQEGRYQTAEIDAALLEGPLQADRANAFLGAATGLGVGSLVSFIVTAATNASDRSNAAWHAPAPVFAALPLEGGALVTVGVSW